MKPHLLNEAISSNEVIAADRAPEPPATTENEPTTADGVDRFATLVSPDTVREIKQRPMRPQPNSVRAWKSLRTRHAAQGS